MVSPSLVSPHLVSDLPKGLKVAQWNLQCLCPYHYKQHKLDQLRLMLQGDPTKETDILGVKETWLNSKYLSAEIGKYNHRYERKSLHNEVMELEIAFFEYNLDLQMLCIAYPARKAKDWRISVLGEKSKFWCRREEYMLRSVWSVSALSDSLSHEKVLTNSFAEVSNLLS